MGTFYLPFAGSLWRERAGPLECLTLLRGSHPSLDQGTVARTVCVGEITGDCGHDSLTRVRSCPDTTRGGTFWVYRLARVNVGCHWAYCAYTEADVPA